MDTTKAIRRDNQHETFNKKTQQEPAYESLCLVQYGLSMDEILYQLDKVIQHVIFLPEFMEYTEYTVSPTVSLQVACYFHHFHCHDTSLVEVWQPPWEPPEMPSTRSGPGSSLEMRDGLPLDLHPSSNTECPCASLWLHPVDEVNVMRNAWCVSLLLPSGAHHDLEASEGASFTLSPNPWLTQGVSLSNFLNLGCYQKMTEHLWRIERRGTYRMKQVYKM